MKTREPSEPTAGQCSGNAPVMVNGWPGTACWYPSMGGYVGKAVVMIDDDGAADVWVWHDGEFPFPGVDQLDEPRAHSPVLVYYTDPSQLTRFGAFLERLTGNPDDGEVERRTWRPLHGRLRNLLRRPPRSRPGEWAQPKRRKDDRKLCPIG